MWYRDIKRFDSKVTHNKKGGEMEKEKKYDDHLIIDYKKTNPILWADNQTWSSKAQNSAVVSKPC